MIADQRASLPDEVLFLRLEGPLMSWGETARWTVRETRLEPTKSGVIGVLAACLGLGRNAADDGKIADLARNVALALRADRPGAVVRDYHTVVGGVVSAEGRVKVNQNTKEPETVVSQRYYLSDACFLLGIQAPSGVLDRLEQAVCNPVWPPFLGRKSCPPSLPFYPALPGYPSRLPCSSLEAALAAFPFIGRGDPPQFLRAVLEIAPTAAQGALPLQRRHDVPISFVSRLFDFRYVREVTLTPPSVLTLTKDSET